MSPTRISESIITGFHELHASWGWFLTLGLLLMVLGIVCVIGDITATFATVFVFGWFLIISGIIALVQAFRVHAWSGFFLYLASALLRGFTGFFMIRYPLAGAIGLTILISSFFIVTGLFRAIGAGMMRFPRWGWSVFSGIVAVVLGIMLLNQMPTSSLWFIGFAVGIDMILEGASLVSVAIALRREPGVISYEREKAA
jgi:uncharacterized membrane protein HdeD (DUF308 family)